MQLTIEVDKKRLADLICAGFEGGIGYWAQIVGYVKPAEVWQWDLSAAYVQYPLSEGGAVLLREVDESSTAIEAMGESVGKSTVLRLDLEAVERGLRLFAAYPKHVDDFITENEDATTGDVFLQLCLLGDIVYG